MHFFVLWCAVLCCSLHMHACELHIHTLGALLNLSTSLCIFRLFIIVYHLLSTSFNDYVINWIFDLNAIYVFIPIVSWTHCLIIFSNHILIFNWVFINIWLDYNGQFWKLNFHSFFLHKMSYLIFAIIFFWYSIIISLDKVLAIFVVIAFANAQIRPILQTRDRDAIILKQIYEPNPDGSYVYRWA